MSVLVDLLSFLVHAALVAAGVVAAVMTLALLVMLAWLVVDDRKRCHMNHASSARVDVRDALAETAMTPLAVDLAMVETLTDVQIVRAAPSSPPTVPASAFPLYTPPALPPVGSSLAVLDGRPGEDDRNDGRNWPPQREGATTYRYVFASGALVRLSSLERLEVGAALPWWAMN